MSAYVLRYAYSLQSGGYRPATGEVHYLYKSVSRSKRHNRLLWSVTSDLTQARTWATREGAEGWLANNLTYPVLRDNSGVASCFVVEEVTA